jgi:hypothetical protein
MPDRRRSTGRRVLQLGAAGAAVAIAVALGSLAGSLASSHRASERTAPAAVRVGALPTLPAPTPAARLQRPIAI